MIILQQNQCFILQNVIILVPNFTFCHSRKSPEASYNVLIYFPLPRREQETKKRDFRLVSLKKSSSLRGENRIRTCEPVLPVTRFPGVPLQPLEHLS